MSTPHFSSDFKHFSSLMREKTASSKAMWIAQDGLSGTGPSRPERDEAGSAQ